MNKKTVHITLFKSSLCPRCHYVQKVLEKITATTPELEVVAVDILSEPGLCLQKQIVMIPALLTDSGKKLSGIWISESRIREFIDQEMAAEKSQ